MKSIFPFALRCLTRVRWRPAVKEPGLPACLLHLCQMLRLTEFVGSFFSKFLHRAAALPRRRFLQPAVPEGTPQSAVSCRRVDAASPRLSEGGQIPSAGRLPELNVSRHRLCLSSMPSAMYCRGPTASSWRCLLSCSWWGDRLAMFCTCSIVPQEELHPGPFTCQDFCLLRVPFQLRPLAQHRTRRKDRTKISMMSPVILCQQLGVLIHRFSQCVSWA